MTEHYPRDLYTGNMPAWCDVYYSKKYNENLYVYFRGDVKSIYRIPSADEVRERIFPDGRASYNRRRIRALFTPSECPHENAVRARLIRFDSERIVRLPKSPGLLWDMLCNKLSLDALTAGRYMLRGGGRAFPEIFYNKENNRFETVAGGYSAVKIPGLIDTDRLSEEVSGGVYKSFESLMSHEMGTTFYCDFLRRVYDEICLNVSEWCEGNGIQYVIQKPCPQMPFLYGEIGFFKPPFPRRVFYAPFENRYIYIYTDDKPCTRNHPKAFWQKEYELIPIPEIATPESILTECGLSPKSKDGSGEFSIKDMYNDYCVPCCSPDTFLNVYGIRSKEEQSAIYRCICKYKYIGHKWLTEMGAPVLLWDEDKRDMNFFKREGVRI